MGGKDKAVPKTALARRKPNPGPSLTATALGKGFDYPASDRIVTSPSSAESVVGSTSPSAFSRGCYTSTSMRHVRLLRAFAPIPKEPCEG